MAKHSKNFYLKDGKTLNSLKGLAKELTKMSEDVYNHHVSPHKNDFANWMRDSLSEKDLANKVDKHLLRIELELETLRHLVHGSAKKTPTKKKAAKKPAAKKKTVKKSSKPKKKKTTSKKKK